jgi:hypothetical protein
MFPSSCFGDSSGSIPYLARSRTVSYFFNWTLFLFMNLSHQPFDTLKPSYLSEPNRTFHCLARKILDFLLGYLPAMMPASRFDKIYFSSAIFRTFRPAPGFLSFLSEYFFLDLYGFLFLSFLTYNLARIGRKVRRSVMSLRVFGTLVNTKFFFSSAADAQCLTEIDPYSSRVA